MNSFTIDDNIQGFFLRGPMVRPIAVSQTPVAPTLPETLIVTPGDYTVMGQRYEMRQEGLYRFLNPPLENRQCIVYRDDIFALMSAVCWLVSHGYRDNRKSLGELKDIAMRGKLILTCGSCSQFAVDLFQELNVPVRHVTVKTLGNLNRYNDGHVLTEVKAEGRWIVFDPDLGALYSHHGQRLNLLELVQQTRAEDYQREPLSAAVPMAMGHFTYEGYAYDLWYETYLSTADLRAQAFCRPVQVPLILEAGVFFYTVNSEDERRRFEALYPDKSLKYLPLPEFRTHFYS